MEILTVIVYSNVFTRIVRRITRRKRNSGIWGVIRREKTFVFARERFQVFVSKCQKGFEAARSHAVF